MKLYEYQAKRIFLDYGIPVPEGYVIEKAEDIKDTNEEVVLKSQVLVGGRGKAGGIMFAKGTKEAKTKAASLLGKKIKGVVVQKVLVEKKLDAAKELYLSVSLDRRNRSPLLMVSEEGGVDIEGVADEKIHRLIVPPFMGLQNFMLRTLMSKLSLSPEQKKALSKIVAAAYKLFREKDCELVEINPLIIDNHGKLWAADAKMIVDSDALYRHTGLEESFEEKTHLEKEAASQGYSLVELDGEIAVIANGAGLTMATLDAITEFGCKARIFLDLGGTDDPTIVKNAILLAKKSQPQAVLVNIFGGVTKCDTVAQGIIAAIDEYEMKIPMVVRISGVHQDAGRKLLTDAGIPTYPTMLEAVKKCAEIVRNNRYGEQRGV